MKFRNEKQKKSSLIWYTSSNLAVDLTLDLFDSFLFKFFKSIETPL